MGKTYLAILAIVFVVGLLIGPGYLVYCYFFSGAEVGKYPVFEKDITRISVGGVESTSSGQTQWQTPITMRLSPEMNPIAINLTAKTVGSIRVASRLERARYAAEFRSADELIWTKDVWISPPDTSKKDRKKFTIGSKLTFSSTSQRLQTFSVTEAGDYVLDIKEESNPNIVASMMIKVRRNVVSAKKAIVIPGFVLCVGSLLGLVFLSKRR
ncbi:MAG: hypothetical protein KAT11_02370 [Phycisphaerae bacterium]|nr:hypothetical protein [Phycisphaerae bacterium]